jgi:hypothetical protein
MRKKSGFTMVEQAIMLVPEFENVVRKLEQQVTLRGQSKSTLNNFIRRIALFVIHFKKLPEQIDPEEITGWVFSFLPKYYFIIISKFCAPRQAEKVCPVVDKMRTEESAIWRINNLPEFFCRGSA